MNNDPYGSHLPFLAWIGQHTTSLRKVLELGAGKYSTPMWLDKNIFPDVELVVSIEDDAAWVQFVDGADPRLEVVVMNVAEFAKSVNLTSYDLVFIDNGRCEEDRIRVIKMIMRSANIPLVVVHDWENEHYRQAAYGDYDWAITDDATPQTALLLRRPRW